VRLDGTTKPSGTPHLCGSTWQTKKVACPDASPFLPHKCGVPLAIGFPQVGGTDNMRLASASSVLFALSLPSLLISHLAPFALFSG
jgi:hypothetical protein